VYEHLCPTQRNCVHNVYERLHLVDKVLDSFEHDFLTAIKDKIISDPFQAYSDRLKEVQQSLNEAQELIRGYLEGNPKDIYGLKN
jgi:5,10-methenyltetrahydromethanopterin hydrogenase